MAIAVDLRKTSPHRSSAPAAPGKKKDKVIHFTGYPLAWEVNRYPLSETLHLLASAPHRELHTWSIAPPPRDRWVLRHHCWWMSQQILRAARLLWLIMATSDLSQAMEKYIGPGLYETPMLMIWLLNSATQLPACLPASNHGTIKYPRWRCHPCWCDRE